MRPPLNSRKNNRLERAAADDGFDFLVLTRVMVFSFRVTSAVRSGRRVHVIALATEVCAIHHATARFWSLQKRSRRVVFRILPEAPFGSSVSEKSTRRGIL